jgi:hypothetical protein
MHASKFLKLNGSWSSTDTTHSADSVGAGVVFAYTTHGVPSTWGTLCTFASSENHAYNL